MSDGDENSSRPRQSFFSFFKNRLPNFSRISRFFKIPRLNINPSPADVRDAVATSNDVDKLEGLLKQTRSNVRSEFWNFALHQAAKNNEGESHYKVIEMLLENGADVCSFDKRRCTPLYYLVQNCNVRTLELILKFEPNAQKIKNFEGLALLYPAIACNFRNIDVLQSLVDLGLDLNAGETEYRKPPLLFAATRNKDDSHYEVFELLLKNGANVNAKDAYSRTAFHLVVENANLKVVQLFLKYEPDTRAVDVYGYTVLFPAAYNLENPEIVQLLIDLGLDVNHRSQENHDGPHMAVNRQTPLIQACRKIRSGNVKIIKCLLRNGADIDAADDDGITPLIRALAEINYIENQTERKTCFEENKGLLDFMIKLANFNLIHDKCHILNFTEVYYMNPLPDYMWKFILEHLAKLQILNDSVNRVILDYIAARDELKNYFEKCKLELQNAKVIILNKCWVTFYNLLVDGSRKLKNYAGNENLVRAIQNNDWVEEFPIYSAAMKKNMEKAIRRRELYDRSCESLSNSLPIFNPNHLIVRGILDNIISKKDLSKLCQSNSDHQD